jgi:hypothetical protein
MQDSKNPHILNAAANLLGVCFFIITGIHFASAEELLEIDRAVLLASLFFLTSCTLSYLSIRATALSLIEEKFERYADYFFLAGIFTLFVVMLLLTFEWTSIANA